LSKRPPRPRTYRRAPVSPSTGSPYSETLRLELARSSSAASQRRFSKSVTFAGKSPSPAMPRIYTYSPNFPPINSECTNPSRSTPARRPAGGSWAGGRTDSQDRMDRCHHAARMVTKALRAGFQLRRPISSDDAERLHDDTPRAQPKPPSCPTPAAPFTRPQSPTRARRHPDHHPPARRSFAASFWAPGLFHRSAVWLNDLNTGLNPPAKIAAPRRHRRKRIP